MVILDEAQRIKNWDTKTAQAVKRLQSRYAFVLTGTPIENRIDEIHSLMDFLNPGVLGPLFRFNREFYELDDRGRPVGLPQPRPASCPDPPFHAAPAQSRRGNRTAGSNATKPSSCR